MAHDAASDSSPPPHPGGPTAAAAGPSPSAISHDHGPVDDDDRIAVHLKRVPFAFVWWLALLCHCGCAAFLCSTTAIYVFLGGINMIYYNKLLGSTLRNEMASLGYVFVAIAALHFLEILRMLWFSLRARKLTFNAIHHPSKTAVVPTVPVSAGGNPPAKASRKHARGRPAVIKLLPRLLPRALLNFRTPPRVAAVGRRLRRFLLRCKTKLFHRKQGLLGLESPYFNALFLFRETTEIASQSYQMYQCSMFISSAWINNLFLAITVTNCWSTPLLQHALARHNALERSVCLSLDGVLDAGTCILIPLVIVFKYIYAFDRTLLEFPIEKLTDPQWFTALILENRMLFAMGKTDLFTSLIPHYSLFGCIRKAKRLIQRLPDALENEELEVTYVNSTRVLVPKNKAKAEHGHGHQLRQQVGEMPGWKRRLVHVFFIGWGTTVLAVHTRARYVAKRYTDVVACKQQLRPWFATSFMCASYQFDCVEQGNVATVTAADLTLMDASTLSSLVISNCPALQMPDELQRFSGLLKVLIYNSTIVSWPSSASLNNESHPALISIGVVASNMSAFPEGLQAQQPDSLQDVRFAQTNLTALPSELSRGWRVSKVSFEYCAFTEYPTVFLNLGRVDELSLAGSQFAALPEALGNMSTSYEDLVLGDNAFLTSLPSSGLPVGTTVLSIENTGISSLPTEVTSPSANRTSSMVGPDGQAMAGAGMTRPLSIYANNTPLCEALGGVSDGDKGTNSSSSVTLYCATRDPNGVARFPLAWTIARFQPS